MRLTKGQLKRIIREEYSKLKKQGLIKESRKNSRFGRRGKLVREGSWSQDPIEDAYMCASETCELEEGSNQLIHDMYYIAEQFDLERLLSHYVLETDVCSEETAINFKQFLEDADEMENGAGTPCAKAFSSFWEQHYMG